MSFRAPTYLDATAVIKLVVSEPESAALRETLAGRRPLVSSAITRTEVNRAAAGVGDFVVARAQNALARLELVQVSERVLDMASAARPVSLPPVAAIHLATLTIVVDPQRSSLITYDPQLAKAAKELGVTVETPE